MNKEKILSGNQLLSKGVTKLEATLPEIGLKDVVPNGTWLEQKQIQAALEAKKHLVEVERIEKSGVMSHAEWLEELQLAEVTQKVGSYWQYFGHNVGKHLYLYPEEAIFLIEVNCLQLKYNDITVSLQQAYSLLLRDKISLLHYKVYAWLSRIGYKVFRYKDIEPNHSVNNNITPKIVNVSNVNNNISEDSENINSTNQHKEVENEKENQMDNKTTTDHEIINTMECNNEKNTIEADVEMVSDKHSNDVIHNIENNVNTKHDASTDCIYENISHTDNIQMSYNDCQLESIKEQILQKLNSRRNTVNRDSHKGFENVPDFTEHKIIAVKAPEEQYIPRNVFLNNTSYVINIENIKTKSVTSPINSRTYTISDEVNGEHVRRVRDSTVDISQNNWNPSFDVNTRFRQFNSWRPRANFNFIPFHFFFQRHFLPNMYFSPRFQFFPRAPPPLFRHHSNLDNFSMNSNDRNVHWNNRKRTRNNLKLQHLENIKKLCFRLKQSILSGNLQPLEAQALHRLLLTYNNRYKSRLRITEQFDIFEDENIVETIELDDDDETKSKKPRVNDCDLFNENFKQLKQLAFKLKRLIGNRTANSTHRRAISNAIKTFNNSFKADVYLNNDYKIIDRKFINLDSSSNSDCVIEETSDNSTKPKPGKMVKNPFSIMKNLSQLDCTNAEPSTSKDRSNVTDDKSDEQKYKYDEFSKIFSSDWLPNNTDFGRPEVPSRNFILSCCREEYIYDFMKSQSLEFENWIDIKIAFWQSIQESPITIHCDLDDSNDTSLNSLLKLEDCTDMPSILNKLRIINNNKETNQTTLTLDFDVYNKDIQNFRKSKRPKPHFRVVCLDESTGFPSGADVAALYSKYDDVMIMFAVVGVGSISFIQLKPTDLPMYIPTE